LRYETELTYTVPLLRKAVFAYWKRSVGVGLPIALALVAAYLIYLLTRGDRSWIVGALSAVIVMGVTCVLVLFLVHYRNVFRKLRDLGPPRARLVAEDRAFTVESDIGISTFHWSSIKEVWRFPTFWLLLFSKAQFMTLPITCLTPDMSAFVLENVRKGGGTIS